MSGLRVYLLPQAFVNVCRSYANVTVPSSGVYVTSVPNKLFGIVFSPQYLLKDDMFSTIVRVRHPVNVRPPTPSAAASFVACCARPPWFQMKSCRVSSASELLESSEDRKAPACASCRFSSNLWDYLFPYDLRPCTPPTINMKVITHAHLGLVRYITGSLPRPLGPRRKNPGP